MRESLGAASLLVAEIRPRERRKSATTGSRPVLTGQMSRPPLRMAFTPRLT